MERQCPFLHHIGKGERICIPIYPFVKASMALSITSEKNCPTVTETSFECSHCDTGLSENVVDNSCVFGGAVVTDLQVWPLTPFFSCFLFCKNTIDWPGLKIKTSHQECAFLFLSSQQLLRLRLGTLKGFLSCQQRLSWWAHNSPRALLPELQR